MNPVLALSLSYPLSLSTRVFLYEPVHVCTYVAPDKICAPDKNYVHACVHPSQPDQNRTTGMHAEEGKREREGKAEGEGKVAHKIRFLDPAYGAGSDKRKRTKRYTRAMRDRTIDRRDYVCRLSRHIENPSSHLPSPSYTFTWCQYLDVIYLANQQSG